MNTIKCSCLSSTYSAQPAAYTRLLHASPDTPSVNVYVNGSLIAKNLSYKQFAGYFTVAPCQYHIQVFTAGKGEVLVAEGCFEICPRSAVTLALIGSEVYLLAIPEVYAICRHMRARCKAYVRFVNLSPNAPVLDVAFAGGTVLFRSVAYRAHTRYVPVEPGIYGFQLRPAGSSMTGLTMPISTFEQGKAYSVYAVGLVGGTPPLETIVSVDGNY